MKGLFPYGITVLYLWNYILYAKCKDHGIGYFWHITDFHVDQNYSRTGNPLNLCHEEQSSYPDNGLYGNFLCDSPQYLINVTIKSMKDIYPTPDFIIWTGDNLPHTLKFDPDWNVVFEAINNVTELLISAFPDVPVFPSIGNHDTFPPNVLLPNETSYSIYDGYLKKGGWDKFLPRTAWSTFLKGGFYSRLVRPSLRIISLNTILWYTPNNTTSGLIDPAYQFEWLEMILKNSSKFSEKVYLIGHVPPGYYNRVRRRELSSPTYHPQYLEMYLQIITQYHDIILGQLYGHIHMDMFQLFQFDSGVFRSSSLLAASVTPWHYIDEYNLSLPVNPSIRLMHYYQNSGVLKDFNQFYLNLTKVNGLNKTTEDQNNLYELLYSFAKFYGVQDLSTESLVKVYTRLKTDPNLYNSFFNFLTAGKKSVTCDDNCKIAQLCSVACISSEQYTFCMKNSDGKENFPCHDNSNYSFYVIFVCAVTLIIGVAICASFFFFCRSKWILRKEPLYEPLSNFQ